MTAIAMTTFGTLPAVRLCSPGGAEATVTLYGAHLVSWKTADGAEHLFCSARSALDGSRAIRGGVPVIFPQFAERGTGMRHGFARVATWRLLESGSDNGAAFAVFALTGADLAPALAAHWPHAFALTLRVALHDGELTLSLNVSNTGAEAWSFSCALHTYFGVEDLAHAAISGVTQETLHVADKLDQIYGGIDGAITLRQPHALLRLEQSGFTDAVVWNPGAADAAALADLNDHEYRRFICIEPALIEPYRLEPGAGWTGAHTISSIP